MFFKCYKCRKDAEVLYEAEIVLIRNPSDWTWRVMNYEERQDIKKSFCLDCWKKEEKNYRKLSWDTFNWRCERDSSKRKRMNLNRLAFVLKTTSNADEVFKTQNMAWNQPKRQWIFGGDLGMSINLGGLNPEFGEEVDKDIVVVSNSSNNSPLLWVSIVIGAAMILFYFLVKIQKKKKRA